MKTVLIGSTGVLAAACVGLFLFNFQLNSQIVNLDKNKERELGNKVAKERELIYKDLEEKHAKEITSYNDLAKQLESQKNLVKELETKAQAQASTTHPAKRLKK